MSKKCQKVDSGPKNGPMMMVYGSLEAYGQVVLFFRIIFFHPPLTPSGGQKHSKNAPFCQKVYSGPKTSPMMMFYGLLEAYG